MSNAYQVCLFQSGCRLVVLYNDSCDGMHFIAFHGARTHFLRIWFSNILMYCGLRKLMGVFLHSNCAVNGLTSALSAATRASDFSFWAFVSSMADSSRLLEKNHIVRCDLNPSIICANFRDRQLPLSNTNGSRQWPTYIVISTCLLWQGDEGSLSITCVRLTCPLSYTFPRRPPRLRHRCSCE